MKKGKKDEKVTKIRTNEKKGDRKVTKISVNERMTYLTHSHTVTPFDASGKQAF